MAGDAAINAEINAIHPKLFITLSCTLTDVSPENSPCFRDCQSFVRTLGIEARQISG